MAGKVPREAKKREGQAYMALCSHRGSAGSAQLQTFDFHREAPVNVHVQCGRAGQEAPNLHSRRATSAGSGPLKRFAVVHDSSA
jgi:hypothetical protein